MTEIPSAVLERPTSEARWQGGVVSLLPLKRACVVAAVLAWVLFGLLLTTDGGLLHRDTFGNFYDAQAKSLLHGHWNIEPKELSLEAFVVKGKAYTYFGPVPAVMRMPVEAITDRFHGRLTRLSMLAAEAVLLSFVLRLVTGVWRVVRRDEPPGRVDIVLAALFVFAAGASSTLYLAGKAWVYHEALLWGAAFSLGSLTLLGEFLARRRLSRAVWAGVLGGLALLTRASVGAGPIVALGLAAAWEAWRALRARRHRAPQVPAAWTALTRRDEAPEPDVAAPPRTAPWRELVVLAAGVVVPICIYAAVNLARFGTAFGLPVGKQMVARFDPQTKAALAANHNGLFGLQFFPTQLLQSLRPGALETTRLFPFLNYPAHHAPVVGNAVFQAVDPASSLTASEPLLFMLALVGMVVLVRPRLLGAPSESRAWCIPAIGAAAGAAGYLFVYFVANRYYADALPFLVVTGAVGVAGLSGVLARRGIARIGRGAIPVLAAVLVGLLSVFSMWANTSLALEDRYVIIDGTEAASRAGWVAWQLRVDQALHGSASLASVQRVDHLGTAAPRDRFAVLGNCTGLFVANGDSWRIVEGDASIAAGVTGHLTSAAPGDATTVAERRGDAGLSRLVWRTLPDGRHRVDLEYTAGGGAIATTPGDTVLGADADPGDLHVIIDSNTHQAELRSDDRVLFNTYAPLPSGGRIEPGPGLQASYSSMDVCRRAASKANRPS